MRKFRFEERFFTQSEDDDFESSEDFSLALKICDFPYPSSSIFCILLDFFKISEISIPFCFAKISMNFPTCANGSVFGNGIDRIRPRDFLLRGKIFHFHFSFFIFLLTIIKITIGAPKNEVTVLTLNSSGEKRLRAIKSQTIQKIAPDKNDAGITISGFEVRKICLGRKSF